MSKPITVGEQNEAIRWVAAAVKTANDSTVTKAWESLKAMILRSRWRPIEEIHEDYSYCVLMHTDDPGYLEIGNCLELDWDESQWTHFVPVPTLMTADLEAMREPPCE